MSKKVFSSFLSICLLISMSTNLVNAQTNSNIQIESNEDDIIDSSSVSPRYFVPTKTLFTFEFPKLTEGYLKTTKKDNLYIKKSDLSTGFVGITLTPERTNPGREVYVGLGNWNSTEGMINSVIKVKTTFRTTLLTPSASALKKDVKYYGLIQPVSTTSCGGKVTISDVQ